MAAGARSPPIRAAVLIFLLPLEKRRREVPMFSLSLFSPPSWIGRPEASTWNFTTSESAEFDALVFAAGKGSFYVTDDDDSDGIVHEILYVGAGLTKSKGPIPFGIGGSFSTPDMPSSGTVSYTHLRAHETRHDLVCRLLLEKKKKK